ncbi:type II toxin-antitoxin system VapC family toxin [Salinisphaera sp.]|uniref:type II toxin-antitoxin system VapC family toxin n=1 Tax=Salinisphaera sp. TaxID=1914330 RepID=UPI002D78AD37|nr:type II toxin-antitoxin system VapC family toxin [Salinisphaera sp.]HET7315427.1 type II toxin-antitoxin system VapC family toxin [Salinisphaera sp.]
MILLLDTHILLWAAAEPWKLGERAAGLIEDRANRLLFSAASIWEIAIKSGLGRADFHVSPSQVRRGLLENDYDELPVSGRHAIALGNLPAIHRDPFDRLLIAQAQSEDVTLVTNDDLIARYPGPIEAV